MSSPDLVEPDIQTTGTPTVPDTVLLRRFVADSDELAFHDLVSRHGPLVMGVCLRVLGHREDAEDAFQATFIVLARRAQKIRQRNSVAAWLYGVAYRVSIDLARKRQRSERPLVSEPMQTEDPFSKLEHEFDRQAVDEELQRLPERYRTPLVLFYMSGKTSKEIAEELGRSQGTVDGQLRRGRQQLRVRLTRRGVALAGLLSVIAVSAEQATAAVSPSLITSTASLALASASGAPIPDAVSPEPSQLAAREILRMSLIKPLTATLCAGLAFVVGTVCVDAFEGPGHRTVAALNTVVPARALTNPGAAVLTTSPIQQTAAQSPVVPLGQGVLDGTATSSSTPGASAGSNAAQVQVTIAAATRQAHTAIEEKLSVETEPIQGGQTLQELLEFVAELHEIQVVIDRVVLEQANYPSLTDINIHEDLSLKDVRLGNALDIIFTQLDVSDGDSPIDYLLENEVLKITTRDRADQHRETRVYDLSRLTTADVEPSELEEVIMEMTSFNTDDDNVALRVVGKRLVIRHNQRTHRQIADLLLQLNVPVGR